MNQVFEVTPLCFALFFTGTKSLSFLPMVHERQTQRMKTRSEWFLKNPGEYTPATPYTTIVSPKHHQQQQQHVSESRKALVRRTSSKEKRLVRRSSSKKDKENGKNGSHPSSSGAASCAHEGVSGSSDHFSSSDCPGVVVETKPDSCTDSDNQSYNPTSTLTYKPRI